MVLTWVSVAVLVVAAIVAAVMIARANTNVKRHGRDLASVAGSGKKPSNHGRVWIIANPTKADDYQEFRRRVSEAVFRRTKKPAMWIETTVEDPGTGQTIEALRHKPSLVVAAGGDGTVRAVAAGMAHARVAMGLLPMGTGNLLARNLGIPLDFDKALDTALTPVSRRMDLAWLRLERVAIPPEIAAEGNLLRLADAQSVRKLPSRVSEPEPDEYAYAVIAGVGFDGETMAHTSSELKKKMGWSAYVFAALKSLRIERMKATVTIFHDRGETAGDYSPSRTGVIPAAVEQAVRQSHTIGAEGGVSPAAYQDETWDMTSLRARTVLFANCGTLPFAVLAPQASLDDGALDVIAIDTRVGLLGWLYLSAKVFGQSAGMKPLNLKNDPGSIQFRQTQRTRVDISRPYPVQIDGDPIGSARTIHARVDPGALVIRVPRNTIGAIPDHDRKI